MGLRTPTIPFIRVDLPEAVGPDPPPYSGPPSPPPRSSDGPPGMACCTPASGLKRLRHAGHFFGHVTTSNALSLRYILSVLTMFYG